MTDHAGVCMKKAITQRESLRQVSANLRGLSLTRLFFAYDKILLQAIWSIHDWSCQCLYYESNHSESHWVKCQLTWEVWAWPGCSLHMTQYCCKQSKACTTGHAGVCMKKWFHNSLVIVIQQISTNHSAMAFNTPAFKAALTRILFTNKATQALIGEGITSLGELKSLSSEDIKTLCKVIREDAGNEITYECLCSLVGE